MAVRIGDYPLSRVYPRRRGRGKAPRDTVHKSVIREEAARVATTAARVENVDGAVPGGVYPEARKTRLLLSTLVQPWAERSRQRGAIDAVPANGDVVPACRTAVHGVIHKDRPAW